MTAAQHNTSMADTTLGIDEIVTLAEIIAAVIGRPLMPQESSHLKTAFQNARVTTEGATLEAINTHLATRGRQ